MLRPVPLIVMLALGLLGSDSPKEWDDRVEEYGLEGTWRLVSAIDGGPPPGPGTTSDTMTFHRGRFVWHEGSNTLAGTYTTWPANRPAGLDLIHEEGPLKNRSWLGVYKLDGDKLYIATRSSSDDRPNGFTGPELSTWIWKRQNR